MTPSFPPSPPSSLCCSLLSQVISRRQDVAAAEDREERQYNAEFDRDGAEEEKKAGRGGGAAQPAMPSGGRRIVPGGLGSFSGGAGKKYVEYTTDVSGMQAITDADAMRKAERLAAAAHGRSSTIALANKVAVLK